MARPKKHDPPSSSAGDLVHTTAKAILGSVPVAGTALAEFFAVFFQAPLEERRQKWMEEVANALRELDARGEFKPEELQNNEQFNSAVLQASQVAQRTHQQEKIDALRNAILNVALPNPPEDLLQQLFLSWIDEFTVWHLRILSFFKNPRQWFEAHPHIEPQPGNTPSNMPELLELAYPDMRQRREIYDPIIRELHSRGLLNIGNIHVMSSSLEAASQSKTTPLGEQFLKFIDPPPPRS